MELAAGGAADLDWRLGARSWLYAPGHNQRLLKKVFSAGADEVLLDLEDAVPAEAKEQARDNVRQVLQSTPAWVRINRPRTMESAADIIAVGQLAKGLRLPKVESPAEVAWVAQQVPTLPLVCTIESAMGLMAAFEIARQPTVRALCIGNADLALDLNIDPDDDNIYARSALVVASRAARKLPPIDGAYAHVADDAGLHLSCQRAKRLGYFGKSAIHPRQVPVINRAFTPTATEVEWAVRVMAAWERGRGAATTTDDGELVDSPVAKRARLLLETASRWGATEH
jgi:citrate lyase subunit beta/citryl-CoA lyase